MGRSAIWGGATLGLVVGAIIGLIVGAILAGILWGVVMGAAAGFVANLLRALSDRGPKCLGYPPLKPKDGRLVPECEECGGMGSVPRTPREQNDRSR